MLRWLRAVAKHSEWTRSELCPEAPPEAPPEFSEGYIEGCNEGVTCGNLYFYDPLVEGSANRETGYE